jgi:hypothetical protein
MVQFTPQTLMAYLVAKYAYLNDNDTKAQQVYDYIMSKQ